MKKLIICFLLILNVKLLSAQEIYITRITNNVNNYYTDIYITKVTKLDRNEYNLWIINKNYNNFSDYIGKDKGFIKLNCAKDTYILLTIIDYDKYGEVIYDQNYSKYKQQDEYISPDSAIEAIKNRVCH